MGTFQNMVSGTECGRQNPLVQLTSNALQEPISNRVLPGSSTSKFSEDELTHEYFAGAPAVPAGVFSMAKLLHTVEPANNTINLSAQNWATEYSLASKASLNSVLNANRSGQPTHIDWAHQYVEHYGSSSQDKQLFWNSALASVESSKWSHQYLDDFEQASRSDGRLMHLSPETYAPDLVEQSFEEVWSAAIQENKEDNLEKADFWDKLESEWQSAAEESEWLSDFASYTNNSSEYQFAENNSFVDSSDPLSDGIASLREGRLGEAVLQLEAAVQRESNNAIAWQYLGIAQAENEQEPSAIAALKRCLQLEPNNTEALMCLTVSYTNESLYYDALNSLKSWILSHSDLKGPLLSQPPSSTKVTSFLDRKLFDEVEGHLLSMAQKPHDGETIDWQIQNALGILYNMSGDYDKAIECFQTALQIDPTNARLWNRLGATLANGNKSTEAIAAYDKALSIYPAFVRARYNVGIACVNLKAYGEAVEHLLSALALQSQGIGPNTTDLSNCIWQTLRFAVRQHDVPPKVYEFIDQKDVQKLAEYFNFTPEKVLTY